MEDVERIAHQDARIANLEARAVKLEGLLIELCDAVGNDARGLSYIGFNGGEPVPPLENTCDRIIAELHNGGLTAGSRCMVCGIVFIAGMAACARTECPVPIGSTIGGAGPDAEAATEALSHAG